MSLPSTSAKVHKILLVAHLPKLIESATSIESKENVKNVRNASQYAYLISEAIIEGEVQPVTITIFSDVNGNKYYNHILPKEELNDESKKSLSVPSAQATEKSDGIPTIDKPFSEKDALVSTEPESSNEVIGTLSIPASSF